MRVLVQVALVVQITHTGEIILLIEAKKNCLSSAARVFF